MRQADALALLKNARRPMTTDEIAELLDSNRSDVNHALNCAMRWPDLVRKTKTFRGKPGTKDSVEIKWEYVG